ncbi:helix-turn-helix domain-containing protein [Actinacidiphila acidipaludis]|uniref:Helix-turn-helix domain-containing protein n=1 Tax=Actinacidiphila acidipaludis TaxID=2873382 RepID=A0ABS7QIW2_9ACTN|nr:helix-turn-helix domain-containing protein [Streptomyces acidipaludis]MBY8883123.1 helix-turn-helix domain-containing protein [Streptomyces acidipaludis]
MAGPEPQPQTPDPSLLTLLGLDAEQDAVYRRLVDHPDCDPAALTSSSDAGEDEIRRHLDALVGRGLAGVDRDEAGERYHASPPILALGPLLEARRAALYQVEQQLADLAERHRTARSRSSAAPVEVLTGTDAIRRRLAAVEREARYELRAMVPAMPAGTVSATGDYLDDAERDAVRRGVRVRTVVQRSWLEDGATARLLAESAARGRRISVVDDVPTHLVIADRDLALLSLDPGRDASGEPAALVVHRGGLLTALITLFELCFEQGWRLRPPGRGQRDAEGEPAAERLDAVDRKIVALLHVGLTDAAIARQLGMGHRTVQRRLQRLMESVGAATRFQLGWHAAVSGWLDRTAPAGP